jgi:hypothetical protein
VPFEVLANTIMTSAGNGPELRKRNLARGANIFGNGFFVSCICKLEIQVINGTSRS